MNYPLVKTIRESVKYWWLSLVLGVFYILLALWVFSTPLASYLALSVIFSLFMLVSGLMEIIFAVSNRKHLDGWGWFLTAGILDFAFGFLLMSYPGLSMAILPLFVAFWLMFKGISAIATSLDLKSYGVKQWGWILLLGIVVVLFSFLIIARPVIGGLSIVYTTGVCLLFAGIFRIALSLKLKSLHDLISKRK
ncbi:HdeD family acid-resistance protein [Pinibacter aurantiacus]|uniref:HdeD family acid-resistance protein n=1 Tax=Pinibacter aurantiacus TaxID=2851599 RepID=A0A9E2SAR7_9BACT|nr:HdeD family acid-resistance protein [Pinibacter aurantiacus]MBV4357894.1 HdeD family acid-resistance protein [Pinibacter aurantiacus]